MDYLTVWLNYIRFFFLLFCFVATSFDGMEQVKWDAFDVIEITRAFLESLDYGQNCLLEAIFFSLQIAISMGSLLVHFISGFSINCNRYQMTHIHILLFCSIILRIRPVIVIDRLHGAQDNCNAYIVIFFFGCGSAET